MSKPKLQWLSFLSRSNENATPVAETVTLAPEPAPVAQPAIEQAQPADSQDSDIAEQDVCVLEAPSAQAMIDLIPSWISEFPKEAGVHAGGAALFDDGRCTWAIDQFGGVDGKTVLELGPLEGGHAYMLQTAGARQVVSIESNRLCFMKCLIAKEILGLDRVKFLLGNFTPWLDSYQERFDVAWVAGVLYHMDEPIRLIRQVARIVDRIYLWTHFIPDEGYGPDDDWARLILSVEDRDVGDRVVPHYIRTYNDQGQNAAYCGGVYTSASWIQKQEIFRELQLQGFDRIETSLEVLDHPHGPCISVAASRR